MPIKDLTAVNELFQGDQLAVGPSSTGDDRRMAVSVLQTFMQANLDFSASAFVTEYSSPLTGATVAIANQTSNTQLIVTPAGTIAALTITLPLKPNSIDKQEILVNSTQIVTSLTIGLNGATAVIGAPTTLAANDFFTLKYDILMKTWYRVG